MFFLLNAAIALQIRVQTDTTPPTTKGGRHGRSIGITIGEHPDSARRRAPRRIPVTPALLASAFRDPTARALLERARRARLSQDSALMGYDATAYQRISAGMGFTKIGRDRLMFRTENVSRVQWQRGVGAWVELKGARTAIPIAPPEAQKEANDNVGMDDMSPVPYYPGYEPLFVGGGMAKAQVDEREIVNPIAGGAEAYYVYQSGDSVSFRLPGGTTIQLRELRVRPRRPKWNLAVGSLWFDTRSGQLVRAAYRLSEPLQVWSVVKDEDPHAMDDVPIWVKPLISPMEAQVTAIAVEYGLYEGRFWLPRIQAAEGSAQVSFMHVPFKMEQSFRYASVNGRDSLPPITVASMPSLDSLPDSLREHVRDSLHTARREARRARRDSVRQGLMKTVRQVQCDSTGFTVETHRHYGEGNLAVAYKVPCDREKLAHSPDLPPSIYDPGEAVFGAKERDALIAEALTLTAQPVFAPLPPTFHWGADLMRYNRIEGFSIGGRVEEQFGAGYVGAAVGRIGTADREPNVELSMTRSNLAQAVYVGAYNHLVSANDWGNPLSFGSSVSALLFGRDEGFYYRATGLELGGADDRRAHVAWRLFAEGERSARPNTTFSLGARFPANLVASRATYAGGSMRVTHSSGDDPLGFQAFTDLRLEAAAPVANATDSVYGRAALDVTLSHGLGSAAIGALTMSSGNSVGGLPAQRRWYLGGAQTIRGQRPDTAQSGNAYWMTRAELAHNSTGIRPVLFGDLGWVGDRRNIRNVGRPMSGVGVGGSVMDGLVRADLSRGLYPRREWRLDLYVEARF